ncbi:MAG: lysophospholipid acyltransferase family protein [Planktomarina sp.]
MANSSGKGSFKQFISYAPAGAAIWVIGKLPFAWRSAIGGWALKGPLGRLIGYRKRIERNLAHVWPHLSADEHKAIADQTLGNAGRTFIENLYPRDFYKNATNIDLWGEGVQAVEDAIASGRSVQFVSGHFGNHEAFRKVFYDKGIPIGGLYRPMSNPFFNKFYEKTLDFDGKAGPKFPTGRDGTHAYIKCLQNGSSALVLLLDVAVTRCDRMDFLGKPAHTSTSAAAFALKADALYVPYFSMRKGDQFSVEIAAPIDHSDPITMTKAANAELEKRITADPGNWFWIHRRWKPDA